MLERHTVYHDIFKEHCIVIFCTDDNLFIVCRICTYGNSYFYIFSFLSRIQHKLAEKNAYITYSTAYNYITILITIARRIRAVCG